MRNFYTVILLILTISTDKSEETCQMLKKTISLYHKIERVLYRYVTCSNLIPSDIHSELISTVNSSSPYLEITNSDLPEISKEMFVSLNLTQLTIDANIQIIHEKTFERVNISTIILEGNKVRRVKDGAFKSFAIYVIDLQNNLLSEVESGSFAGVQNLRKLYLQNNQISNIQLDSFKDLGNLDELNLSFNHLSALPSKLFDSLMNLNTVYLSNNYIKELETGCFVKNKMLQDLYINNNYLTYLLSNSLPNSISNIIADFNNIKFVKLSNLVNLKKLILDSNKISDLKNSFSNLDSLNWVNLNNNLLGSSINNNIFNNLTNITILELDNNQITNIKNLRQLKTLEALSLAENYIKVLDFTVFPTNIKLLNLTRNYITTIQNISILSNLTKLELSYNNLQQIDYNTFENLNQLHNLWLNNNQIKSLSLGCFRSLRTLDQLDLSNNKISKIIPGVLNGLDRITDLNIGNNNLSYLSDDIFHNMKELKYLNIAYNNLSNVNIKGILTHTIWLREIDLKGNNWTCKLLINLSRDNKLLSIKSDNYFNVSNVYGIPCSEEDHSVIKDDKNINDGAAYLNNLVSNSSDISNKLNIIVVMIIVYLVLIFGKYILSKYSGRIVAAKQFVYQNSVDEPEIYLV